MWKRGVNKTIPDSFPHSGDLQGNPEKCSKHVSGYKKRKISKRADLFQGKFATHDQRPSSQKDTPGGDYGLLSTPVPLYSAQLLHSAAATPSPSAPPEAPKHICLGGAQTLFSLVKLS